MYGSNYSSRLYWISRSPLSSKRSIDSILKGIVTNHEAARRRRASLASLASALAVPVIVAFFVAATAAPVAPDHKSHSWFSYEGSTGPDKWVILNKDWAICHKGTKQSPIDISKVETHNYMGPLKQTYWAGTAIMQNRGHDFMLTWKNGNGKVTVQGKDYTLQQVHWHVPSEHTLNGTRFDMEMHMVHEDASKGRAVVSLLFSTKQAGQPSKTISHLGPYFRRLAGKEDAEEQVKEPVDPAEWLDEASGYYRYDGSLTTPPCTEGVIWTIMSKVKHISKEQIHLLESATKIVEPNDRPAQRLNARVVRYYEPETKRWRKEYNR